MPKTKKQAPAPLFGSPTFVATFADGEVTRMTVFGIPDDVDVERAKRLGAMPMSRAPRRRRQPSSRPTSSRPV